jgi:archaellum component FlaF (FlaF/FlaG flagellin family)
LNVTYKVTHKEGVRKMSKSTLLRAASLFLGILLCLVSVPAAFAQTGDVGESVAEPAYTSVSNKTIIHEINPSYYDLYLQQGESSSFTVNFKNNGKKALDVEPRLVSVPESYYDFDESWIAISPANVTVDSGAEQEFTIEVSIPEDADGENYQTYIAFADDIMLDPEEYYPQYVNVMYLSVMVPVYQKIELQTCYIYDTVEAGEEYEYTTKIKNVAARNITIDPEVTGYDYSFDESGLEDAIEISAPSVLAPGEIADMVIRVPVPENATGSYSGYVEMNVDGKENYGYDPQIDLNFIVRQQPSVPYVKTFETRTADPITIEVSTYAYGSDSWLRSPPKNEVPSFELNLKYDSSPVDMTLVKITQSGSISVGWNNFPVWSNDDAIYQNNDRYYTETYTIPGAIGDWELTILPKNTENFEYSITFGDSE